MCVVGVLLASTGCGEDGGGSDAGVREDAAVQVDANRPDASTDAGSDAAIDSSVPCAEGFCAAGEACLRDVCVASCGGDVSALEVALGEGLVPVQNFCVAPVGPATVYTPRDGAPHVYAVETWTSGASAQFMVRRWPLDPALSSPTPELVGFGQHRETSEATTLHAGGFLDISPDGTLALLGFTTSADFDGRVVLVYMGEFFGSWITIPARGNFDARWIDDRRFVVNGLGFDGIDAGQGLYLGERGDGEFFSQRTVAGLGNFSGSVVALDATTLLVGGYAPADAPWGDAVVGSRIFAIPTATVLAATTETAIEADGTASIPRTDALGGTVRILPGRGVVSPRRSASSEIEAFELRTLTLGSEGLVLGAPSDIATPPLRDPRPADGDRILFEHPAGYLLVE